MSGALRVNKSFSAESLTWEPLIVDLCVRWCQVKLRYYPIVFSPGIMGMIAQDTKTNGWHTSADWIALAGIDPDCAYVPNSLVTLSQGQSGRTCMRLRASDWVGYLARVRAGTASASYPDFQFLYDLQNLEKVGVTVSPLDLTYGQKNHTTR